MNSSDKPKYVDGDIVHWNTGSYPIGVGTIRGISSADMIGGRWYIVEVENVISEDYKFRFLCIPCGAFSDK